MIILSISIVCVATIDKFSSLLKGEKTPTSIEDQFKKYCTSTKNDKEKRLVSKIKSIITLKSMSTF